jgi:hypothetical protein
LLRPPFFDLTFVKDFNGLPLYKSVLIEMTPRLPGLVGFALIIAMIS